MTHLRRNRALFDLAQQITDEVISPITLQVGKRYVHPEEGVIRITAGCYRAPDGGISNHWHWIRRSDGEPGHGYGANWPEWEETP